MTLLTTYLIGRDHEALGYCPEAAKRYRVVVENADPGPEHTYCINRLYDWGYYSPAR